MRQPDIDTLGRMISNSWRLAQDYDTQGKDWLEVKNFLNGIWLAFNYIAETDSDREFLEYILFLEDIARQHIVRKKFPESYPNF